MDGSTLYFDDAVPPHCSVGVDLFFFCSEPGRELRGVRNLPAGVHVVHLTSGLHNTRTAQLLELDGRSGYAVRFCHRTGDDAPYTEIHTVRLDWHSVVPDTLGRRVVDYGALAVAGADWRALRFDRSVLGFVRSPDGVLRTHDSTGPELRRLRQQLGGGAAAAAWPQHEHEPELLLSGLDFTTSDKRQLVRLDRTGPARTADFLDKTWLVRAVWGGERGDGDAAGRAVAECKFAFLGAAVVNNTGCFGHFVRVVHLLLHSDGLLQTAAAAAAVCELFRFLYVALATLQSLDLDEDEDEDLDEDEQQDAEQQRQQAGQAGLGAWRRTLLPDIRSFGARVDSLHGLPLRAQFQWGQLQTLLGLAACAVPHHTPRSPHPALTPLSPRRSSRG